MNTISKPLLSSLEVTASEVIDYGIPDINKFFQTLDVETKKKITKHTNKEIQKNILKSMMDPELTEYYNKLPEKSKKTYDDLGPRDKYTFLKKALNEKKKKESEKKEDKKEFDKKKVEERELEMEKQKFKKEYEKQTEQIVLPIVKKEDELTSKDIPEEIFGLEEGEIIEKPPAREGSPQQHFDNLVKKFYDTNPYISSGNVYNELEVKFGTRGIKPLTRNDYDNVIKTLKSFGFTSTDYIGKALLRINWEFLDSTSGRFKPSDIRVEIVGLHNVENYCKNNDLKMIFTNSPTSVDFVNKKPPIINGVKVYPVNFDDFNFKVAYQIEEKPKIGVRNFILDNWRKSKKEFRYINRVAFEHPDYPFLIDISIVKYSNKAADKFGREGRGQMIKVYTIEESNVFNNIETYEIEIEINNKKIGPGTKFNSPIIIVESLRKAIKLVLSGLQGTNYPISYPEQNEVLQSYMKLIWKDEYQYDPKQKINNYYFIGPNSVTLQIVNIAPIDENSNQPNIRKDFVVTDKADGERRLMYISDKGKIYLISTNMDIIFTGAKTNNELCFNSIIDGELILHDKNGTYINLYAAFDIYYYQKKDIRDHTFMLSKDELDINKSRYYLLKNFVNALNPVSIMNTGTTKNIAEKFKKASEIFSPIKITTKEFFPMNDKQTIFEGCNQILKKERENRFEYNTDGLIFTHSFYGVGSEEIGKAGPKTKITWVHSFKWKPPQYNTIDFLVTTNKQVNGDDLIKPIFEDGINAKSVIQLNEYKIIELRCGFSESKDGYINPCQDIIEDKMPQIIHTSKNKKENDYLPRRFYPTDPYDPKAGLCNIMLKTDESGIKQMFSEENEAFGDNTIVEFRYDFEREEGWRWVPLRVRYDKTARYLKGEKEFGNSYKTCNENWKSIHPAGRITGDMLSTGLDIPDIIVSEDKYYNTPAGKFKTEAMKNFHNLYVKKLLITGVSKQGDTLIDYACGKAGDLPKWIASKLSFVFGIDYSKDNLENRLNGACARFLDSKKMNKNIPSALFVHGNSSFNIRNGSAMLNDKAKQITAAIFGIGPKEPEKIGKGVAKQYGKHDDGFNVSSCQFAIHYFLESPDTLRGFVKNLAECTKLNGYFIGTAYDGKIVFDLLKKTKQGEGIQINEDGKKIWEIIKMYNANTFDDNSSCIGYKIDVYQESINQLISEYLINFDYLNRILNLYGFKLITREEANELGIPDGTGLFSELFMNMLEEISKNKFKAKDYGKAANMSAYEQKISFLNRYFVYKKFAEVNTEKVILELSEYEATENIRTNIQETNTAIEIAKDENKKLQPKVRKLSKKIVLLPATEAVDEQPPVSMVEKALLIKNKKSIKKETKEIRELKKDKEKEKQTKKLLIIESDDED